MDLAKIIHIMDIFIYFLVNLRQNRENHIWKINRMEYFNSEHLAFSQTGYTLTMWKLCIKIICFSFFVWYSTQGMAMESSIFLLDEQGRLSLREEVWCSWRLGLGRGRGAIRHISPKDMKSCQISGNTVTWQGRNNATVQIQYKMEEGIIRGTFSYKNLPGVEEIDFPHISMPYTNDIKLLLPKSQGCLVEHIETMDKWERESLLNCRLQAFQFLAVLSNGRGIYMDCHDSEFYNKSCRWELKKNVLHGECVFPLPLEGQSDYEMPYSCGIATFDGSWYEAASLYRPWAIRQHWYRQAVKNGSPLKDISMWVWNRGRIKDVMPPVERLAKEVPGKVALDWYWWHHNPYDTDYPDFWPPREGETAFRDAVQRMNQQGIFTQVYLNGRTWDLDGSTYKEGGDKEIEIMRNGKKFAIAFNSYNHHRLGYMCGTAKIFQTKMEEVVDRLFETGLPGVYLDMIGCTVGSCCYNPQHSHAPGGGKYNINGYRNMLKRMRQKHPDRLFSTEDCSELALGIFDSSIVLFATSPERMGYHRKYVPVFNMLYHGASATFGSYALPDGIPPWDELWPDKDRWPPQEEEDWNKLYPDQFFCELSRDIVWGLQPMICNFQMKHIQQEKYREVYDFIRKTASFRHQYAELLYFGTMGNPGKLECASHEVAFMARGIFTHKDGLEIIRQQLPVILHCVWEWKGKRFLILANYTSQKHSWTFGDASGILESRSYEAVQLQ